MAKKDKETVLPEGNDMGGTEPGVKLPVSATIETEQEAFQHVKDNYTVPEGCDTVYVTQDKNVFWKENHSSAHNHAVRKDIKLFTLQWDYQK